MDHEKSGSLVRAGSAAATVAAANDHGGPVVAWTLGCQYPSFQGATRADLAATLRAAGLDRLAKRYDERYPCRYAATAAVARLPKALRLPDGAPATIFLVPDKSAPGRKEWAILRGEVRPGEDPVTRAGARVIAVDHDSRTGPGLSGVEAAAPVDAAPDAACLKLAEEIRARAEWFRDHCDTQLVSQLISEARNEVGAPTFVSSGSYLALAGNAGHEKLVALFRELRARFYSPERVSGVQANVVVVRGESADAITDAVINGCLKSLAELAARCAAINGDRAKTRPKTIDGLIDAAREQRAEAERLRAMLGAHADAIARACDEAIGAATALVAGVTELPAWMLSGIALDGPADPAPAPLPPSAPEAPVAPATPTPQRKEEDDLFSCLNLA